MDVLTDLQQLDPVTIGAAAVAVSFLVNLMALGIVLGRGENKTLKVVDALNRRQKRDTGRLRQEQAAAHKELRAQLGDLKADMKKLQRRQDSLAALQLSQGALGQPRAVAFQESPPEDKDQTKAARSSWTRRYSPIDKKHHIYSLARRGVPSKDISRRLKVSRGETELVLGLKQFIHSQEAAAGSAAPGRQELPN